MSKCNDINELLEYSRKMIKQIDHIKGNSMELEDAKTLAFAGMVSYYGQEYFDDVYLSFLDTDFVCCDDSIVELLTKKYDVSKEALGSISNHEMGTFYEVSGYQDEKTKKIKLKRVIYIDKSLLQFPDVLVERIVHQMNHVINSRKNSICRKQGRLASRMGMALDYFSSRQNESLMIEETINGLQTEDICGKIRDFGCFDLNDSSLSRIINLMSSDVEEFKDYDIIGEVVKPLYDDSNFRGVLVDKRLSGRLSGIREEFDSKAGEGTYNVLLACCDEVAKAKDSSARKMYRNQAKTYVKRYTDVSSQG